MIGLLVGLLASCIFIYPVFQGLVLLPLDLLVSNSSPWFLASQILIKNSYMLDSIIQMYPWHHLTFSSLTKAIIPLWNPYQFTGMPFMASMKPMVFYPLNILFLLGEIPSWNILLFFQLFFAFFFSYLFMRRLQVSVGGSLLTSVAFAFSSLMIGFLQFGSDGHTLIWLPFLAFCIYSYVNNKNVLYLIGVGLGLASAIFAGHLQMVAYECGLLVFFVIYLHRVKLASWKDVFVLFGAMMCGIGIASIQLLPGIELFALSGRGAGLTQTGFISGLIRPYEILRIFSPDLFGHPVSQDLRIGYIETSGYFGLVPLFFTFFTFSGLRNNHIVKFFWTICIFSIIFSMWPFGLIISFLRIPIISSGSGGRLFFLALFSGAILSGYGLDLFLKNQNRQYLFKWITIYVVFVLMIFGGAYLVSTYITFFGATIRNLKFCTAIISLFFIIVAIYLFIRKKHLYITGFFIITILLLSYFDVFRMGYRFLTFSNSKFLYPDIPVIQFIREKSKDTLERTYGLTGSEIPTALNIYSIETYNPLYPARTAILFKALEGNDAIDFPTNIYEFAYSERLKYVLDVLGVSYIVTENAKNPAITYLRSVSFQNDFTKIYQDERHDVYKNNIAYKRFDLFYDIKSELSEKEILDDIRNRKTDLSKTVLLEAQISEDILPGTGSAQLIFSDLNTQKFSITSDKPAIFYISDAYDPGWVVKVNGQKSRLYRANYNFRAILVPPGESEVIFQYKPLSFTIGLWMSGISFTILISYSILVGIFRNKPKNNNHNHQSQSQKHKKDTP